MRHYGKRIWQTIPILRLLLPLTAGILSAQYLYLPLFLQIASVLIAIIVWLCINHKTVAKRYRWKWVSGCCITILFYNAGSLLLYANNESHYKNHISHHLYHTAAIRAVLKEAPVNKTNTYKATATVTAVLINHQWEAVNGDILVYFKKDSTAVRLQYGTEILIKKQLQPIANSGNPGAFDYKQYCAYQQIYQQVYLQPDEYRLTGSIQQNHFVNGLFQLRNRIRQVLKKWIPGDKNATLAEALLIGYRDDLDKELVRAYSNTGVVHIIAISGLHLGMIYGLVLFILKPLQQKKWMRWVKPLIVLTVLWGFSVLAGAAASVIRSAVMFSFVIIGESIRRRTHSLNTLAASAFCLLCCNPFLLWDLGFQLSYAAVTGILIFRAPVYRLLYIRNRLLNNIWQLNAICLSAQLLTLPLILYYFHQFPNLFIFTNLFAVPLTGFILTGGLFLLLASSIPLLNGYTGKIIAILINTLNNIIESTDKLPFVLTRNIHINLIQAMVLFMMIGLFSAWLMQKKTNYLLSSLGCLLFFVVINSFLLVKQKTRLKMIVYNIPQHQAIDLVEGSGFCFVGDTGFDAKNRLRTQYLDPSRNIYRVQEQGKLSSILRTKHLIAGPHQTVLLIDRSFQLRPANKKIAVDKIIFTGNPDIHLAAVAAVFDCKQYIFDNSNRLWKIQFWKKAADSLHLRHQTISEQGAFEMDL
jgi:competence protein ComEC